MDKLSFIIQNPTLKQSALAQVKSFLAMDPDEAATGVYNPNAECNRKENFSIILANGDVHPCNIIEYTHDPVVGNIFHDSFTNIWSGDKFKEFRQNDYRYCKYCPVNIRCSMVLR